MAAPAPDSKRVFTCKVSQFLARRKPPSGAPSRHVGQRPPLTTQGPRGTITPASPVWQTGGLPDGPLYLGLGSQGNFKVKLNFCTTVSLTAGTLEWGAHYSLTGPRKSHGHTRSPPYQIYYPNGTNTAGGAHGDTAQFPAF